MLGIKYINKRLGVILGNPKHAFKKRANPGIFSVYFRLFLHDTIQIQIDKSIDGVLGIRTRAAEWKV